MVLVCSCLSLSSTLVEAQWNSVGGGNNLEEAAAEKTIAVAIVIVSN